MRGVCASHKPRIDILSWVLLAYHAQSETLHAYHAQSKTSSHLLRFEDITAAASQVDRHCGGRWWNVCGGMGRDAVEGGGCPPQGPTCRFDIVSESVTIPPSFFSHREKSLLSWLSCFFHLENYVNPNFMFKKIIKEISCYKNNYNNYEKCRKCMKFDKKKKGGGGSLTHCRYIITNIAYHVCQLTTHIKISLYYVLYIFNPIPPWQLIET